MARKGENIYKRKDGRYEGRYIKSRETDGTPKWGYVYGHTYGETKEKLYQKKAQRGNEATFSPSGLLLCEWVEQWIVSQKQIKSSTKTMYYSHLKNHINPAIGKVSLQKLSAILLQQFVDGESEVYSAKTVHTVFSVLRLSLQDAAERGYIGQIYSGVKLPKVKRRVLRILSPAEQKRLEQIIAASDNQYDIGILICLYTGLRIGELCALRWENIDLNNGTISVLKTVQRVKDEQGTRKTKIHFGNPKSLASVRIIPIPTFLIEILKKYRRANGYILRPNGSFTDTRTISRRFKKLLRLADIPDLNFHITRHSFATRALELGMDAKTLSEILGHASVSVTMNLYAHSLPEHKRKEMEKFNALFQNTSE